ncbi:hypothetical protein PMAYCL1PPCAC_06440, partial [Pristionchus mayeri]
FYLCLHWSECLFHVGNSDYEGDNEKEYRNSDAEELAAEDAAATLPFSPLVHYHCIRLDLAFGTRIGSFCNEKRSLVRSIHYSVCLPS